MVIVTRPRGRRPYVLEAERKLPPEQQTTFYLEDLKEQDRVAVMNTLKLHSGDSSNDAALSGSGTRVYKALKAGLRGWENLRYSDGDKEAVPYKSVHGDDSPASPSDEALSLLQWNVKVELSNELLAEAFLGEEDKEK